MSEKERALLEKIAQLPADVQYRFYDQVTGAVTAVEALKAAQAAQATEQRPAQAERIGQAVEKIQ